MKLSESFNVALAAAVLLPRSEIVKMAEAHRALARYHAGVAEALAGAAEITPDPPLPGIPERG